MAKKNLIKNVFTVSSFTMLSRVLGLVREMLQSRLIGAGIEQSAFTLAFALPNMFRKLFGEGALTAAFVPIFKTELEQQGLAKAEQLARAVMTMVLLMLAALVVLVIALLGGALSLVDILSARTELTIKIVIILFPYMFAICAAAFGMGIVNAMGKFKASSFMPSLLNIVWIATLAILSFLPGLTVRARIIVVALAILFAGFIQMAFMFRCMARCGVRPIPTFNGWKSAQVVLVWRNLGIAALGASAIHINYLLDQLLAWLASPWAAGVIGYAERLMDLPLGVIGVAFGTVLLPTFAGHFAKRDEASARKALADSVRNMMYIMIPSSAGLFILAPEITRVIYEGGSFDNMATIRVARALSVYALGLGVFGLQKTLVPWFQAQQDMKTPLRVSIITVVVNAILNIMAVLLLPVEWRHVGLAASTVVCAVIAVALLIGYAKAKNGFLGLAATIKPIVIALMSSLIMLIGLIYLRAQVENLNYVLALGLLVTAGAALYAIVVFTLTKALNKHQF